MLAAPVLLAGMLQEETRLGLREHRVLLPEDARAVTRIVSEAGLHQGKHVE